MLTKSSTSKIQALCYSTNSSNLSSCSSYSIACFLSFYVSLQIRWLKKFFFYLRESGKKKKENSIKKYYDNLHLFFHLPYFFLPHIIRPWGFCFIIPSFFLVEFSRLETTNFPLSISFFWGYVPVMLLLLILQGRCMDGKIDSARHTFLSYIFGENKKREREKKKVDFSEIDIVEYKTFFLHAHPFILYVLFSFSQTQLLLLHNKHISF